MPKVINPLTFAKIKISKPKEKLYKLSDGGGLSLWIYPTGKKIWAFKYREEGKQKNIYLGEYPSYSLSDAREWREQLRVKLETGAPLVEDPDKEARFLFESLYNEWYERWAEEKKSDKYAKQVKSAVDTNVLPLLKGRDIREIRPFDIVESLKGMEERGVLEYLRRTKSALSLMFGYAVDCGLIDFNPVMAVGKQAFKKPKSTHFDALAPNQLDLLIKALNNDQIGLFSRCAIYWQFLTMTRPNEAVSARWQDLDLENKRWIIPPEVMKKNRLHIVPLSPLALSMLPILKEASRGGTYLFEGRSPDKHLNKETPRILLRRVGLPTTAHGLRSLGATILEEVPFPEAYITAALSHAKGNGNKTTPAYLRSTFYNERIELMDYLSDQVQKSPFFRGFLV